MQGSGGISVTAHTQPPQGYSVTRQWAVTLIPLSPLAGVAGLEPANSGAKIHCLTTWLHPSIKGAPRAQDTPVSWTKVHKLPRIEETLSAHRTHHEGKRTLFLRLAFIRGLEPRHRLHGYSLISSQPPCQLGLYERIKNSRVRI